MLSQKQKLMIYSPGGEVKVEGSSKGIQANSSKFMRFKTYSRMKILYWI